MLFKVERCSLASCGLCGWLRARMRVSLNSMTAATASIQMDLTFVGGEGEWIQKKAILELRRFFSKVRPLQWLVEDGDVRWPKIGLGTFLKNPSTTVGA